MDVRLCAYPLSAHERQTLETGISEERPKLPDQVRDFVVHEIEPVFVDKHTHFRKPFHIARCTVSLRAVRSLPSGVLPPLPIGTAACCMCPRSCALACMTQRVPAGAPSGPLRMASVLHAQAPCGRAPAAVECETDRHVYAVVPPLTSPPGTAGARDRGAGSV